jgi:hypothetical protein
MEILTGLKANIKDVIFHSTPTYCPYTYEMVEVIYKSGNKQVITHKTDNLNDLNKADFQTAEELRNFYQELIK